MYYENRKEAVFVIEFYFLTATFPLPAKDLMLNILIFLNHY
jgi:hypothetical protein